MPKRENDYLPALRRPRFTGASAGINNVFLWPARWRHALRRPEMLAGRGGRIVGEWPRRGGKRQAVAVTHPQNRGCIKRRTRAAYGE